MEGLLTPLIKGLKPPILTLPKISSMQKTGYGTNGAPMSPNTNYRGPTTMSMGVRANSPELNQQTRPSYTLPKAQTYTPPKTNMTTLDGKSVYSPMPSLDKFAALGQKAKTTAQAQQAFNATQQQTQAPKTAPVAANNGGLPVGQFRTPSGAIVDGKTGALVQAPAQNWSGAPSQSAPTDPNAPYNTGYSIPPMDAQAGLIQQLVNMAQMSPQEQQIRQEVGRVADEASMKQGQLYNRAIPLEFQTGRANVLANLAENRIKALEAQAQTFGQQRQVATDAYKSAAGLYAPIQVSPGNYLSSPTGQPLGGGQAQGFQNLTQYGIAQQNISQGQKFQQEAAQLDTTIRQIDTLEPVLTQFLNKSGLNSQNAQFYNKAIGTYMRELGNPADATTLNAMMADLKTYTAQILGSSGLNPTEVSDTVNSFDPSALTPAQLTAFLSNLRNLGQIRLQPLQQNAQQSYGSNMNGASPYAGNSAQPSFNSTYGQSNQSHLSNFIGDSPEAQGLTGMILNTLQSGGAAISGLAGMLFHR
jgi:hypothetical protein